MALTHRITATALAAALALTAVPVAQAGTWGSTLPAGSGAGIGTIPETPETLETPDTPDTAATQYERNQLLTRLIEEEKLAYDLYSAFSEKYGTRPFQNISASEINHQNQVLALLTAAGQEDPRLEGRGEFRDPELQEMYTTLLERGMVSLRDAYQVGYDFEVFDIEGLEKEIAATPAEDTELHTLLAGLLQGSRNHLNAFTRQLGMA